MPFQTKTAAEIVAAIRQHLHADESIAGLLSNIPYLSVHALPPGLPPDAANWAVDVAGNCPPAMMAAIQRAVAIVQAEVRLAVPPLGSSAFGG